MKKKIPTKVRAPKRVKINNWITNGKEYEILKASEFSFEIISDGGKRLFCFWNNCEHLNGKNWIITERA